MFKRSSCYTQHCNIANGKSPNDIVLAIQNFLFLIGQPPKIFDYIIDNYSCKAHIGRKIDLASVYSEQRSIYFIYQPEKYQALEIRCPSFISPSRKNSLCCLLYKSGKCTFVGGNKLEEIQSFFDWIKYSLLSSSKKSSSDFMNLRMARVE